jgi:hypothetical protein
MTTLKCPICSCEAIDSSRSEMLSARQPISPTESEVVICHCAESHRFVVSSKDPALTLSVTAQVSPRGGVSPEVSC